MKSISATTKNVKTALSLEGLMRQYELSNIASGLSPKTIDWYTEMLSSLSRFVKSNDIPDDVSSITVDNIRKYIVYLKNKHKYEGHPYTPCQDQLLSPETIRCHVRVAKSFSSWLCLENLTEENRLERLKLPKAQQKIIEPLTQKEIQKIIKSIDRNSHSGERNYAIFCTALDTGLRASELANITLPQLNLESGFIKVMGKGSKERVVPIGKHVRLTLLNYIEKARPALPECNYLFVTNSGNPISLNTLKLMFRRLGMKSGVTRLHAHLCRHTFAINYLLNGGDVFSLKSILGHSSLEMVNRYLYFTSAQITERHHQFSPMDKFNHTI